MLQPGDCCSRPPQQIFVDTATPVYQVVGRWILCVCQCVCAHVYSRARAVVLDPPLRSIAPNKGSLSLSLSLSLSHTHTLSLLLSLSLSLSHLSSLISQSINQSTNRSINPRQSITLSRVIASVNSMLSSCLPHGLGFRV